MAEQKQGDQLEPTDSSSVRIQGEDLLDAMNDTRGGERGQAYPCWWHDKMMNSSICTQLNGGREKECEET